MSQPVRIYAGKRFALIIWTAFLAAAVMLCFLFAGDAALSTASKAVRLTGCALAAVLSAFGVYSTFSKRFEYVAAADATAPAVEIDDEGITCRHATQQDDHVKWADLVKVQVLTTDEGPWNNDVFILLQGSAGNGVAVPQDSGQCSRVVDIISKLPGFDFSAFTAAMTSTEVKWFDVWTK